MLLGLAQLVGSRVAGWADRFVAKRHLPPPTGPYDVGFVDVMSLGEPSAHGAYFRLYYPAAETHPPHAACDKWPIWAEDQYLCGILRFMQAMARRWPSWVPCAEFLLMDWLRPVLCMLPEFCFPTAFRLLNGKVYLPILEMATVAPLPPDDAQWPLVVFSHGMGCSRFAYSQLCSDLASYGLMVAATEHRDGSACFSSYQTPGTPGKAGRDAVPVEHRCLEEHEHEYQVRNEQAHRRLSEVIRTLDTLERLNSGADGELALVDVVVQRFVQRQLLGRIAVSKPIVAGHSFGGATAALALHHDARFRLGLLLDAWTFPIKEEKLRICQPLLTINTQSFLHAANVEQLRLLASESPEKCSVYIAGSVHQNHMDSPFIVRNSLLKRMFGMHSTTPPDVVLRINNVLMLRFIRDHVDLMTDAMGECVPDLVRPLPRSPS